MPTEIRSEGDVQIHPCQKEQRSEHATDRVAEPQTRPVDYIPRITFVDAKLLLAPVDTQEEACAFHKAVGANIECIPGMVKHRKHHEYANDVVDRGQLDNCHLAWHPGSEFRQQPYEKIVYVTQSLEYIN